MWYTYCSVLWYTYCSVMWYTYCSVLWYTYCSVMWYTYCSVLWYTYCSVMWYTYCSVMWYTYCSVLWYTYCSVMWYTYCSVLWYNILWCNIVCCDVSFYYFMRFLRAETPIQLLCSCDNRRCSVTIFCLLPNLPLPHLWQDAWIFFLSFHNLKAKILIKVEIFESYSSYSTTL